MSVTLPAEFIQYGSFGMLAAVLIWFMNRNEKVLNRMIDTQERLIMRVDAICTKLQKD